MKSRLVMTIMLAAFFGLFVTPNSAKSGLHCDNSCPMQGSLQQSLPKEVIEEEDAATEFTPLTSLIPCSNLLFN